MAKCIGCGGSINHIKSDLAKCNYCGKVYSVVNGELKDANLASVYDYASLKAKSQNEEELQEAITIFEAIGSYKDGYNRAMECRNIIRRQRVLAEERRLEARRQAELEEIENEKKRQQQLKVAKIKGITIACAVVCVIVIVGIVVITSSVKRSRYDKAMELYNLKQYEEALEAFQTIEGYSDSKTYIADINSLIKERENAYSQGVSFYNSGLYEKAIGELADISGYLDVKDYIENASSALYRQAKEMVDAEEYATAKEKLETIPKECNIYTQGQVLLTEINDILIAQENAANYEMAVNYFNSEQYEMAQPLFIKLGTYEDATNYLSQIGTIFYNKANELYNQKEYVQCGDMLTYIDTSNEWSDYTLVADLYNKAAKDYKEIIIAEAKSICRKEGYSSMALYIDKAVCSLMSKDTASELKIECEIEIVCLQEMEAFIGDSDEFWYTNENVDNMGNSYKYNVFCGGDAHSDEITYAVDGKYTVLTGDLALRKQDNDMSYGIWLEFYGDDKKLGETVHFSKGVRPYTFEIDITGVSDLRIVSNGDYGYLSSCGFLLTNGFMVSE